jgi:hypothetical protein
MTDQYFHKFMMSGRHRLVGSYFVSSTSFSGPADVSLAIASPADSG